MSIQTNPSQVEHVALSGVRDVGGFDVAGDPNFIPLPDMPSRREA
jgi:hypothetical protein